MEVVSPNDLAYKVEEKVQLYLKSGFGEVNGIGDGLWAWYGRDFAEVKGFRPFRDHGLALRRTILDEILLRRAESAGARVSEGCKVTDVLRDDSGNVCGVRVDDEKGVSRELRSRLVIGADGLRSAW